ncbi:bifunctional phosphoribosyl-AMP cyclohydrolase/phosphoribosyl-ATP diphosphatase HisIE [Staphylococcus sp. 17KM0847]|uniref:bifunctional phosphoribosyl-AMP cyclohydrolase/phosphoribosyl-ATP diphosphatase HisIE n=1 Tax=Staphylococcus sp. 17KM0847 TaxID=2583989 RepID=UPI0015DCDD31|nr:bifunctional phosphoribosyl-AMP cyclohydrolase/phosphoribosyl-ATP diphosphatase HisIE [Staphylococcus sp. 17KM0847]QLK86850.1 bifunctional phosphoribosyl-AMP cyclohydrolase/phosphoribosyl-ATP diphosphatase HisIE [Staphylococcus sp. 17KM0847]
MALNPDFSKGLLPAILQDVSTQQVLMLGYMNEEAFKRTHEEQVVWFYSRSKQRLWKKGETSGHIQQVVDMHLDCDADALLIRVHPQGPTCHKGTQSCFNTEVPYQLQNLETTIQQRIHTKSEKSYTHYLLTQGKEKITKKFGEEAFEVVIAALKNDHSELIEESADLLYHFFVLLHEQQVQIADIEKTLAKRHHTENNFKGERRSIEHW